MLPVENSKIVVQGGENMNNRFSENLKKIRKDNNLSQEQLADEIGVSRQAISKWESAAAYPEMDKIIILCDKFNLNIDDLLHKDIREAKGEEESKKKINNYINGFLNFITDSIDLFTNMNLKSKFKFLFEEFIIIFTLFICSCIVCSVFNGLSFKLFSFLPGTIRYFICNTLSIIFTLLCIIVSIVILVHIFKIRYLNYYSNIKNSKKNNNDTNDVELDKNVKIDLKRNDNRIIIRDPKHSEYKFINGLFKFIVVTIKFFLLCFGLGVAFGLVCLFITFILSFLVYKTGALFIGLLISILSSSVIAILILLLILNFVFNRKNDKKKIIWTFICSLIFLGIGCGLIFIGTLKFDVEVDREQLLKTVTRKYEMNDDMIIYPYYDKKIQYVESDNDNVKIEYVINKYCDVDDNISNNSIMAWSNCTNPTELVREFIKNINDKKIVLMDDSINSITVYTSKTNIDKLKNNYEKQLNEKSNRDETINSYEKKIDELLTENNELKQKINDLQLQMEDYD